VLAHLHINWLLNKDEEIPPLNQKFFQNVLVQVSEILYLKEMPCKYKGLVSTYEALCPMGYKPGYRDYINTILGNGCEVIMETATKNHLSLNFYKQRFKYIQNLRPKLSKGKVYDIMKGIYNEKYSGSNLIVLELQKLLGDQVPTTKAIVRNPMNVLRVYREILKYYKEYEEKKTPYKTEFHQRKCQKEKKMVLQKRGM
jgi:hypothetical protein